jgi:hypothetical protein
MTTELSKTSGASPPTDKLTKAQRATVKLWADKLMADYYVSQRCGTRQLYDLETWCAKHGDKALMECPHVSGKPLRECTRLDLTMSCEAYAIVSDHHKAMAHATESLKAESEAVATHLGKQEGCIDG